MTPAQLERQRQGIGSSDAPAVIGVSPWATALDVYLSKTMPSVDSLEHKPQLEWGQRLEPAIAGAIIDHYGWRLERCETLQHTVHDWLIATPDRVNGIGELIEIKSTSRSEGWGEPETAEIPLHYWVQVQHQLEVVNSLRPTEVCWVFVLVGQCDFRRYRVTRDPNYFGSVEPVLKDFWGLVQSGSPPAIDWSHRSTIDAIQRLYQPAAGIVTELGEEAAKLAGEYEQIGIETKRLQDERIEIKARLIEAMGNAESGLLPDGRTIIRKLVERNGYTVDPCTYVDFRIKKPKGVKS